MARKIVVIGAGAVGLSTAYYAARRGYSVVVLDRESADHENCSFGNAGLVVPSHFIPLAAPGMVKLGLKWMWNPESPFYIKPRINADLWSWAWRFYRASTAEHVTRSAPLLRDINLASRGCFDELADLTENEFEFEKKGLLCLCKTEQRLEHEAEAAAQAEQLGLKADVLNSRQAAELDPGVRMDIVGAVYFPDDCHLSPNRFMKTLARLVVKQGVHISWNTEVTGWRTSGNRLEAVQTTNGDFSADEYAVCGGSWSPGIVRGLGLKIPIQGGKGYSLTVAKPKAQPRIPAILTERRVAVTPMGKSLRFGGTMEIAGLTEEINPARVRGILKSVPMYYPDFSAADFEGVEPWCGLRPCSPDGLPYIGRTKAWSNLLIGTGHAMMGLSLGPITGRLLAEILTGDKPSVEMQLLDPDRYGHARKGRHGRPN